MSFEAQDKGEILKRLQTHLKKASNGQSIIEGTFNADMLTANAIEFEQVDAEIELIIEAAFANTSWGEFLSMRAAEYGVIRKEAEKAKGMVKVTGQPLASVIKGSLFATVTGVKFYTTQAAVLDGEGKAFIPVTAEETGTEGNVAAGEITEIPMSIPGVISVTNPEETYNGFTEESDAELLARYLLKVRTPATSGNKYHYKQWALSVNGVGQAEAKDCWNGPGTVKVNILDSNNATASAALIDRVAAYIESVRPIGATVTIASPAPKAVDIAADIYGTVDTEKFKEMVNTYFKAGDFGRKKISYAKIGALLMSFDTVTDYDNLTLNGTKGNITIGDEELAAVGEVDLRVVTE